MKHYQKIGKTPTEHQMSIFDVALESFIDMNHELALLSRQIDWEEVESEFSDGCRSVQHQALDEQECLVLFCLLVAGTGRTPRECVIWNSRGGRLEGL